MKFLGRVFSMLLLVLIGVILTKLGLIDKLFNVLKSLENIFSK